MTNVLEVRLLTFKKTLIWFLLKQSPLPFIDCFPPSRSTLHHLGSCPCCRHHDDKLNLRGSNHDFLADKLRGIKRRREIRAKPAHFIVGGSDILEKGAVWGQWAGLAPNPWCRGPLLPNSRAGVSVPSPTNRRVVCGPSSGCWVTRHFTGHTLKDNKRQDKALGR